MAHNRLTTEEFIRRAKMFHGDTYDYSETQYVSSSKKVKIRCRKHGVFEQTAGQHIHPKLRTGCPYCAGKAIFKGENDLLSQAPDIAAFFDEEANQCTASDVFAKSNKKYWWKCDNGLDHRYQMRPLNKVSRGAGCPICSGQQLLSGFNDLQTRYPGIAKEWEAYKNVISLESMYEYYWWMWARANLDVCGI